MTTNTSGKGKIKQLEEKKKYTLVVWCSDCYQEDFDGCFGGDYEREDFTNLVDAIKAGEKYTKKSCLWKYEIKGATKEEINNEFYKLYGYYYS